MSDRAGKGLAARRRFGVGEAAPYVLIIGAVALGWQIGIQPLIQRAPVELAVRLAPGSPTTLRRAAESELTAGRNDNAATLGREALARAPFDVRALRVVGLTEARAGREDRADEILTLAGNWSLRDDPAHAWLVERRLRRGDYASAFAHADTLARRREDIQPQVFRLFTAAGLQDPRRARPVLAAVLTGRPPWRAAYLDSLHTTPENLQLAAHLAVMLEAGGAPLNKYELEGLYQALISKGQIEAISAVRAQLKRADSRVLVTNGGFADTAAALPFQWRLMQKAGIIPEIVDDDLRPSNPALRVDYDGYATGTIVEQLTSLAPGSYRFSAEIRNESDAPASRLAWTLVCAVSGATVGTVPVTASGAAAGWTTLSGRFEVPGECRAQWLRLETRAGDTRSPTAVWFDRVSITPAG